jgi:hypothetical protein
LIPERPYPFLGSRLLWRDRLPWAPLIPISVAYMNHQFTTMLRGGRRHVAADGTCSLQRSKNLLLLLNAS